MRASPAVMERWGSAARVGGGDRCSDVSGIDGAHYPDTSNEDLGRRGEAIHLALPKSVFGKDQRAGSLAISGGVAIARTT